MNPTMSTREAAAMFGVSEDALYDAAARRDAPVAPVRVGRCLRWPTARILDVLGITEVPT